jgi:antitoxin VapB
VQGNGVKQGHGNRALVMTTRERLKTPDTTPLTALTTQKQCVSVLEAGIPTALLFDSSSFFRSLGVYCIYKELVMITKVFQSGNSQAIRVPKEFQLEQDEVEILRRGDELIIRPIKRQNASILFDLLSSFAGDLSREEFSIKERDW